MSSEKMKDSGKKGNGESTKNIDKTTIWLVLGTIIAALLGAAVGSFLSGYYSDLSNKENLKIQKQDELKFIAQGLSFEINQIQPDNDRIANLYIESIKEGRDPPPSFWYFSYLFNKWNVLSLW
jgi:hypothetical protein